ncbi:MAG: hypothetical protein AMXMBFR33_01720 [Candidatus Xenobia bacterium]
MSNWLEMPAGPELDALAAERALEWNPRYVQQRTHGFGTSPLPLLSTDPGQTWLIVEAMEQRGGWEWILTKENGRYSASFQHLERNLRPEAIWADTLPLAICRAALAALEHAQ